MTIFIVTHLLLIVLVVTSKQQNIIESNLKSSLLFDTREATHKTQLPTVSLAETVVYLLTHSSQDAAPEMYSLSFPAGGIM
jgi:hypothetical protein